MKIDKLKKCLLIFTSILSSIFVLTFTTSCGSNEPKPTEFIDISNLEKHIFDGEDIEDPYDIDVKNTAKATKFEALEEYYYYISFNVSMREDYTGYLDRTVDVNLEISNSEIISATRHTTSNLDNIKRPEQIKDIETGNIGLKLSFSVIVDRSKDVFKDVVIVLKIRALRIGDCEIIFNLKSGDLDAKLTGIKTAFSDTLSINPYQIETPVVEYDANLLILNIYHVKHATYYIVNVDGGYLRNDKNEILKIEAKSTHEGNKIIFKLYEYISGTRIVKIQAHNNDAVNTKSSAFSDEIFVSI